MRGLRKNIIKLCEVFLLKLQKQ